MSPVDIASYVGTALALIGIGFGASRAYERYLTRPKQAPQDLSDPRQLLRRLNVDCAIPDLRQVDIVGYSVHSMYDDLHPLVDYAVRTGAHVRLLMLAPSAAALREKARMEHSSAGLEASQFLARSQQNIRRTIDSIEADVQTIMYQANISNAKYQIRLYDALPIYRAVLTNVRSATSSYLQDLSTTARDFPMTMGDRDNPTTTLEEQRARQWVDYLVSYRSRPANSEAVLFDLYDTLVRIDPEKKRRHTATLADYLGVSTADFVMAWDDTKERSNAGLIPSTEARFYEISRILNTAGIVQGGVEHLANMEHSYLRNEVRLADPLKKNIMRELRVRGYRIGLVSNCSPSVQYALLDTPIFALSDACTFSYAAGAAKPASNIYGLALQAIGSGADRCVFVGDGNDDELRGAAAAGIRTVRAGWYEDQIDAGGDVTAYSVLDLARSIDPEAAWQL